MPSTIDLRVFNKMKLLEALKVKDVGTKNSLSRETGLSVATCGNLLAELIQSGMAVEVDAADSTGGRPSRRFKFNRNHAYILSIFPRTEADVLTLNYAVADMLGEVVEQGSLQYGRIGIPELEEKADSMLRKYPGVSVISVGIPGVIWNGRIGNCDFRDFEDVNLEEYLYSKYSLDIVIENDVNAAAFGYYRQNCCGAASSLAYIYYPDGHNPGAGIVIGGKIHRGASNFAGEIGWLPGSGKDDIAFKIAEAAVSVNCVINPEQIIISGIFLDDEIIEGIRKSAASVIPGGHLPSIIFEKDFRNSYAAGLIFAGLEKYSESLKSDNALLQENI